VKEIERSRRTLALVVVAAVMVIDIIDLTIVNVAIPTLQRSFGAGDTVVQWLVAGYATIFAILIISGGRLGDIYGYRRMLQVGVSGFVVTSLLCGLASNPAWLVAGRLLQGAAAALMLPQVAAFVQVLYPPEERVAALGMFGILGGTAAVAGPILGGLLLGANLFGLGWRPIFLINVPVGGLVLIAIRAVLPHARSPHPLRIDWPGTLLATACLAAVMLPLVQGRAAGWPWWSIASLVAAPLLGFLTLRYSRRRMARDGSALFVPALFRERSFAAGMALAFLLQMTMAGLLFTLTLMLQEGLGYRPAVVGIIHAPFAIGVAAGIGVLSRRILPHLRAGALRLGAFIMAAAFALLGGLLLSAHTGLYALMPTLGLLGLGFGMISGPLSPIALSEIDVGHAGIASGTLRSVQEIGGATGVALIGGAFLSVRVSQGAIPAFLVAIGLMLGLLALLALGSTRVPDRLRVFASRDRH